MIVRRDSLPCELSPRGQYGYVALYELRSLTKRTDIPLDRNGMKSILHVIDVTVMYMDKLMYVWMS